AGGESPAWNGRNHFFAAAAEAIRRILVESARRKLCEKRGGGEAALSLADFDVPGPPGSIDAADLLNLDEALERLASEDPQKAELVKLRYFAGLSLEESAAALGVSRATASRYWDYARSWLFAELSK